MIFGSDNQAGASQQVLDAVNACFSSHGDSYGFDNHCEMAEQSLKELFETDLKAFFVATGTAANALALSALVKPWGHVVCHHQAHILNDENTAPELFSGSARQKAIQPYDVIIKAPALEEWLAGQHDIYPHTTRPQALSISQASEIGHIYSVQEVTDICRTAKRHGLKVHMDGARFSNAVARLECTPAELSCKAGVDVLCLGATKNGAIAAEAVIFFDTSLAEDFLYSIKRTGHMLSKGRFFGAQFNAWLKDGHWLGLAKHANDMADRLVEILRQTPGVELPLPIRSNEVFAILPEKTIQKLSSKDVTFYDWPASALTPGTPPAPDKKLVRFVTSFMTREDELGDLQDLIRS